MIITCPNCNKQFKIDNSLIPSEGRELQCGSCDHIWFYDIKEKNHETLKLNEEKISKNIEIKTKKNEKIEEEKNYLQENIKTEIKKEKNSEKPKKITTSKKIENLGGKLVSFIIVFIVSFVALIILLDTLKTPIIEVFPGFEIILFNLFETLQDIKLFIIDLF